MKSLFNHKILIIVFGSLLFAACKKQLDIQPRQSIDFNTALTNSTGIEAAIAGIYGSLRDQTQYGRDKLALSDALSDITLATGKSGRLQPENRNTLNAHFAAWTSSYYYINQINLVLDAIPNISDATSATKDRWEGEMKFLRALLFQDLAKIYAYDTTAIIPSQYKGNVVLSLTGIKTADQAQNSRLPRASTKSVYDAIYADLNTAIAKLGNNPRNVSGGAQVYYANKAAAHALLCRAALHYGDWATVITQATNALSNASGVDASLQTAANYVAGWRSTRNPESLFEVRFAIQNENLGVNVSLQTSYTTLAALGAPTGATGGFGDLVPNNFLLSQLGITSSGYPNITRGPDVRAQLYEWGTAGRGTRFIECTKFFGKSGFPNLDNVPVLRIPELYLNRAEAYYRSGNQPLALADLNTILTKRGLASVSLSDTALLNEILRQKMLEYAFEGYRWFDLKRNGMDVNKTYIGLALIPFNDKRILPPIPRSEIDGNPNIQQNPGY